MRIIGIDPGYAIVGFGIIEYDKATFNTIAYGAITTPTDVPFERRLKILYDDFVEVLAKYKPEYMSIERLYFNTNHTTAIDVAQARGVIMLGAAQANIAIGEYTPLQIKLAVTGYGQAVKKQVQEMTKRLLKLPTIPKPDDTADALAIAICHAHSYNSQINNILNRG